MKHLKYIIGLLLIAFLIYACRKDEVIPSDNGLEVIPDTAYTPSLPSYFPAFPVTPSNPLTKRGVELGRMLFYDPILSKDGTISCSSCHSISNSFSDNKAFSLGVDGTPGDMNAMALVNVAWQSRFFWNGRAHSLEQQAVEPINNPVEMHETSANVVAKLQSHAQYPTRFKSAFGTDQVSIELIAKAISQFERTLISKNSLFDGYPAIKENVFAGNPSAKRGFDIYSGERGQCFHCHGAALTLLSNNITDSIFRNNGLLSDAEMAGTGLGHITGNSKDDGKFKVPTLRNIALTAPYMHDGRFATLEEVVNFYATGIHLNQNIDINFAKISEIIEFYGGVQLDADDRKDVVAFLKCLTDTTFINNPEYKDPFNK
jgi:cytochrome c peroxidase